MSNNNNNSYPSAASSGNSSLDSMARRYKDEMMRIYRMNGSAPQGNVSPAPAAQDSRSCRRQEEASCRFMTAEEIIENQPAVTQGSCEIRSNSDITDNLINGTAASPNSLTAQGSVNSDTNSRNSSGQSIFVPQNTASYAAASYSDSSNTAAPASEEGINANSFGGIMIYPTIVGSASSGNIVSNILSELLPSFAFPPDIEVGDAVPAYINPAYIILNSWFNLTGDNGWGYLQFEVTTGSLGNPVQNATVVVSRIVNNQRLLTRIIKTDASGLTKTICLPAPKGYPTPHLYVSNSSRPFAEYTASVYANNYYPVTDISLLLEAGVKSVQPVDMVPLPDRRPLPGIMPRSND